MRTMDAQGQVADVHQNFGVTDYNVEEAQVKRAAIRASQRRIVAAHGTEIVNARSMRILPPFSKNLLR